MCPPGQYTDNVGRESCSACPAGKYAASPSVCSDCPAGTYSVATGLNASSLCTRCGAGKYSSTTGATSNTTCQDCMAGTFSVVAGASSMSVCTACSAGKYLPDKGAASESMCILCGMGKYAEAGGNDAEQDCLLCSPGSFSNSLGATSASVCTACPAGKYVEVGGSTNETACVMCPMGTYASTEGNNHVDKCLACVAGKFSNKTGQTSDATCMPCPHGTFSDAGSSGCSSMPCTCSSGNLARWQMSPDGLQACQSSPITLTGNAVGASANLYDKNTNTKIDFAGAFQIKIDMGTAAEVYLVHIVGGTASATEVRVYVSADQASPGQPCMSSIQGLSPAGACVLCQGLSGRFILVEANTAASVAEVGVYGRYRHCNVAYELFQCIGGTLRNTTFASGYASVNDVGYGEGGQQKGVFSIVPQGDIMAGAQLHITSRNDATVAFVYNIESVWARNSTQSFPYTISSAGLLRDIDIVAHITHPGLLPPSTFRAWAFPALLTVYCSRGMHAGGGGVCTLCPANTYKYDYKTNNCVACGANAIANPGSFRASMCACAEGFEGCGAQECRPCRRNFFKPFAGPHACMPCPAMSYALEGSASCTSCKAPTSDMSNAKCVSFCTREMLQATAQTVDAAKIVPDNGVVSVSGYNCTSRPIQVSMLHDGGSVAFEVVFANHEENTPLYTYSAEPTFEAAGLVSFDPAQAFAWNATAYNYQTFSFSVDTAMCGSEPRFVNVSLHQANPFARELNNITLSVVFNVFLRTGTQIVLAVPSWAASTLRPQQGAVSIYAADNNIVVAFEVLNPNIEYGFTFSVSNPATRYVPAGGVYVWTQGSAQIQNTLVQNPVSNRYGIRGYKTFAVEHPGLVNATATQATPITNTLNNITVVLEFGHTMIGKGSSITVFGLTDTGTPDSSSLPIRLGRHLHETIFGVWHHTSGTLAFVWDKAVEYGEDFSIEFSFIVRNPSDPHKNRKTVWVTVAARFQEDAGKDTVFWSDEGVVLGPASAPPLFGIHQGSAPLVCDTPQWSLASIQQSSPLPGVVNTLTIQLNLTNFDLPALSTITLLGLTGTQTTTADELALTSVGIQFDPTSVFWDRVQGRIVLTIGADSRALAANSWQLTVNVRNPEIDNAFEGPAAVFLYAHIYGAGDVPGARLDTPGPDEMPEYGVVGEKQPLRITKPVLSMLTIEQATPVASVPNTISLAIMHTYKVHAGSQLNVSGLSFAHYTANAVLLENSNYTVRVRVSALQSSLSPFLTIDFRSGHAANTHITIRFTVLNNNVSRSGLDSPLVNMAFARAPPASAVPFLRIEGHSMSVSNDERFGVVNGANTGVCVVPELVTRILSQSDPDLGAANTLTLSLTPNINIIAGSVLTILGLDNFVIVEDTIVLSRSAGVFSETATVAPVQGTAMRKLEMIFEVDLSISTSAVISFSVKNPTFEQATPETHVAISGEINFAYRPVDSPQNPILFFLADGARPLRTTTCRTVNMEKNCAPECKAGEYMPIPEPGTVAVCQACTITPPGNYCPGFSPEQGLICPEGYFCVGGSADKVACTVLPGYSCPPGTSSMSGQLCPAQYYCSGINAPMQGCAYAYNNDSLLTSLPGSSTSQDCVCPPGYTSVISGVAQPQCARCIQGTHKALLGNSECMLCHPNTYQPFGADPVLGNITCAPCRQHSQSPSGSTFCECNAGYSYTQGDAACIACQPGHYKNSVQNTTCNICPFSTFNPNRASVQETDCISCTEHANTTSPGSTAISDCHCNIGFKHPEAGNYSTCIQCTPGTYNSKIHQHVCTDCSAGKASHQAAAISNATCETCPSNTFSGEGQARCSMCQEFSVSVAGSKNYSECLCIAGYSGSNLGTCTACTPNTYKNTTTNIGCTSCPPNSGHSLMNASDIRSCRCNAGYTGPDGGPCEPCAIGSYKTVQSSAGCLLCGAFETTESVGGAHESVCVCKVGYSFSTQGDLPACAPCKYGFFKNASGDIACTACPDILENTTQLGSTRSEQCVCVAGYTRAGGPISACSQCRSGFFKGWVGNEACSSCEPASCQDASSFANRAVCTAHGMLSPEGSTAVTNCTCRLGFQPLTSFDNCDEAERCGCSICPAGTYKNTTGDATCTLCPAATYMNATQQGETAVSACAVCPDGQISRPGSVGLTRCAGKCAIGQAGDPNSDIPAEQCQNCGAPNKYQNAEGQATCKICPPFSRSWQASAVWCVCDEGYYLNTSFVSDETSCVMCPIGTYKETVGNTGCTVCSPGTYDQNGEDGSAPCEECNIGKYSNVTGATTAQTCKPCPAGTFSNVIGGSTVLNCTLCPAGKVGSLDRVGLSTEELACVSCGAGKYLPEQGAVGHPCFPCPTGTFSGKTGLKSEAQCELCNVGTFSSYTGATSAAICTSCLPGTYNDMLGASSCRACPPGTFLGVGHGKHLSNCTGCALGSYATGGNSICSICPVGTHMPVSSIAPRTNITDCEPCKPGTQYVSNTNCSACARGSFSRDIGLGEYAILKCTLCPAGTASNETQRGSVLDCKVCEPGYYSGLGATGCTPCPPGSYSNKNSTPSEDACTSCPANTFSTHYGSTSEAVCVACDEGTNSMPRSTSQDDCLLICVSGTYGPYGSCQNCPLNTYSDRNNMSACIPCPRNSSNDISRTYCLCNSGYYQGTGSYIVKQSSQGCQACVPGKFRNQVLAPQSTECTSCVAGSWSSTLAGDSASVCKTCPALTFSLPASAAASSCVDQCPPGMFGTYPVEPCQRCPGESYKAVVGNFERCTDCPANSVSSVLNISTHCVCKPGFTLPENTLTITYNTSRILPNTTLYAGLPIVVVGGSGQTKIGTHTGALITVADKLYEYTVMYSDDKDGVTYSGYVRILPYYQTASACTECPAGSYKALAENKPCAKCPSGKISVQSRATSPSTCVPCGYGTYSEIEGGTICDKCRLGFYGIMQGGTSHAQACKGCPAGSYFWSTDPAYAGATSSAVCILCPAGKFSSLVNASGNICIQCPAGKYGLAQGANSSAKCIDCPAGSYSLTTGAASKDLCLLCVEGKYSTTLGANTSTACEQCPKGSYQNTKGAQNYSACASCPAGTFQDTLAAMFLSACKRCSVGKYSNISRAISSSVCQDCTYGKYSTQDGASSETECLSCAQGKVLAGLGGTSADQCLVCPQREYCPTTFTMLRCPTGAWSPRLSLQESECVCLPGFYKSNGQCLLCEPGYYCHTNNKTQCPLGTYTQPKGEATSEKDCKCPPGFAYVSVYNRTCVPCPAGAYCPGGGSAVPCPTVSTTVVIGPEAQALRTNISACVCSLPRRWNVNNECVVCENGTFFDTAQKQCLECPRNAFCTGGVRYACQNHAESFPRSSSKDACSCRYGYHARNTSYCAPCQKASNCPQRGASIIFKLVYNTTNPGPMQDVSGLAVQLVKNLTRATSVSKTPTQGHTKTMFTFPNITKAVDAVFSEQIQAKLQLSARVSLWEALVACRATSIGQLLAELVDSVKRLARLTFGDESLVDCIFEPTGALHYRVNVTVIVAAGYNGVNWRAWVADALGSYAACTPVPGPHPVSNMLPGDKAGRVWAPLPILLERVDRKCIEPSQVLCYHVINTSRSLMFGQTVYVFAFRDGDDNTTRRMHIWRNSSSGDEYAREVLDEDIEIEEYWPTRFVNSLTNEGIHLQIGDGIVRLQNVSVSAEIVRDGVMQDADVLAAPPGVLYTTITEEWLVAEHAAVIPNTGDVIVRRVGAGHPDILAWTERIYFANATACRPLGIYGIEIGDGECACQQGYGRVPRDVGVCHACLPGTFSEPARGAWCEKCPEGTFCASGLKSETCPPGTVAPPGSSLCTQCGPGTFVDGKAKCTKCTTGFYCPTGLVRIRCPGVSISLEGSTAISACMCPPGTKGLIETATSVCQNCSSVDLCPGAQVAWEKTANFAQTYLQEQALAVALNGCVENCIVTSVTPVMTATVSTLVLNTTHPKVPAPFPTKYLKDMQATLDAAIDDATTKVHFGNEVFIIDAAYVDTGDAGDSFAGTMQNIAASAGIDPSHLTITTNRTSPGGIFRVVIKFNVDSSSAQNVRDGQVLSVLAGFVGATKAFSVGDTGSAPTLQQRQDIGISFPANSIETMQDIQSLARASLPANMPLAYAGVSVTMQGNVPQSIPGASLSNPVQVLQALLVCPEHSKNIGSCVCDPGYYTDSASQCTLCPAGKYTPPQDVERKECALCPKNTYCSPTIGPSFNTPVKCPMYSNSSSGSFSIQQCVCKAGFYRVSDHAEHLVCTKCSLSSCDSVKPLPEVLRQLTVFPQDTSTILGGTQEERNVLMAHKAQILRSVDASATITPVYTMQLEIAPNSQNEGSFDFGLLSAQARLGFGLIPGQEVLEYSDHSVVVSAALPISTFISRTENGILGESIIQNIMRIYNQTVPAHLLQPGAVSTKTVGLDKVIEVKVNVQGLADAQIANIQREMSDNIQELTSTLVSGAFEFSSVDARERVLVSVVQPHLVSLESVVSIVSEAAAVATAPLTPLVSPPVFSWDIATKKSYSELPTLEFVRGIGEDDDNLLLAKANPSVIYKDSTIIEPKPCPPNATYSTLGVCICKPGFGLETRNNTCSACGAGTYSSLLNSTHGPRACVICPAGSFCPFASSVPVLCPGLSSLVWSAQGATSLSECLCRKGYFRVPTANAATFTCTACSAGEYCPAEDMRYEKSLDLGGFGGFDETSTVVREAWLARIPVLLEKNYSVHNAEVLGFSYPITVESAVPYTADDIRMRLNTALNIPLSTPSLKPSNIKQYLELTGVLDLATVESVDKVPWVEYNILQMLTNYIPNAPAIDILVSPVNGSFSIRVPVQNIDQEVLMELETRLKMLDTTLAQEGWSSTSIQSPIFVTSGTLDLTADLVRNGVFSESEIESRLAASTSTGESTEIWSKVAIGKGSINIAYETSLQDPVVQILPDLRNQALAAAGGLCTCLAGVAEKTPVSVVPCLNNSKRFASDQCECVFGFGKSRQISPALVECQRCLPGTYSVSGLTPRGICKDCPRGSFCMGGTHIQVCPPHASSTERSANVLSCYCEDGWRANETQKSTVQCLACGEQACISPKTVLSGVTTVAGGDVFASFTPAQIQNAESSFCQAMGGNSGACDIDYVQVLEIKESVRSSNAALSTIDLTSVQTSVNAALDQSADHASLNIEQRGVSFRAVYPSGEFSEDEWRQSILKTYENMLGPGVSSASVTVSVKPIEDGGIGTVIDVRVDFSPGTRIWETNLTMVQQWELATQAIQPPTDSTTWSTEPDISRVYSLAISSDFYVSASSIASTISSAIGDVSNTPISVTPDTTRYSYSVTQQEGLTPPPTNTAAPSLAGVTIASSTQVESKAAPLPCHANSTQYTATGEICVCLPGFAGTPVPPGTKDATCQKCDAGKYTLSTGTREACTLCPANSYCTGGTSIKACATDRVAPPGASRPEMCQCPPKLVASSASAPCVACVGAQCLLPVVSFAWTMIVKPLDGLMTPKFATQTARTTWIQNLTMALAAFYEIRETKVASIVNNIVVVRELSSRTYTDATQLNARVNSVLYQPASFTSVAVLAHTVHLSTSVKIVLFTASDIKVRLDSMLAQAPLSFNAKVKGLDITKDILIEVDVMTPSADATLAFQANATIHFIARELDRLRLLSLQQQSVWAGAEWSPVLLTETVHMKMATLLLLQVQDISARLNNVFGASSINVSSIDFTVNVDSTVKTGDPVTDTRVKGLVQALTMCKLDACALAATDIKTLAPSSAAIQRCGPNATITDKGKCQCANTFAGAVYAPSINPSKDACQRCAKGNYWQRVPATGDGVCTLCSPNFYCPDGITAMACPYNLITDIAGVSRKDLCKCAANFKFDNTTGKCVECSDSCEKPPNTAVSAAINFSPTAIKELSSEGLQALKESLSNGVGDTASVEVTRMSFLSSASIALEKGGAPATDFVLLQQSLRAGLGVPLLTEVWELKSHTTVLKATIDLPSLSSAELLTIVKTALETQWGAPLPVTLKVLVYNDPNIERSSRYRVVEIINDITGTNPANRRLLSDVPVTLSAVENTAQNVPGWALSEVSREENVVGNVFVPYREGSPFTIQEVNSIFLSAISESNKARSVSGDVLGVGFDYTAINSSPEDLAKISVAATTALKESIPNPPPGVDFSTVTSEPEIIFVEPTVCPANSIVPPGSVNCECDQGYIPENEGVALFCRKCENGYWWQAPLPAAPAQCVLCPANSYCPNGLDRIECKSVRGLSSVSPVGSSSLTSCVCIQNFKYQADDPVCRPCNVLVETCEQQDQELSFAVRLPLVAGLDAMSDNRLSKFEGFILAEIEAATGARDAEMSGDGVYFVFDVIERINIGLYPPFPFTQVTCLLIFFEPKVLVISSLVVFSN